MTQTMTTTALATIGPSGNVSVPARAREDVRRAVIGFLDAATTATGRKTFYNSKEEQDAAEKALHDAVWSVNRGLYGAMLTLPGVSDRAAQLGLQRLLDEPRRDDDPSFLTFQEESRLLAYLARGLPPQRLFKLFGSFQASRINNRRTRTLILRSILGAGDMLPFWAVKYRDKLRVALRHALGTGVANGICRLVSATDPRTSGSAHMARYIDKYILGDKATVYECLAFILGGQREWTQPLFIAFTAAKSDLTAGATLPPEVLWGIRGQYHKATPKATVLELAKRAGTITESQKLALQQSAKDAGVELAFDPTRQDLVRLYVYALETGDMTAEIRRAMDEQARKIAATFPLRYRSVGVVVDCSASMFGAKDAKNRPLAIVLAMRDVLLASAESGFVESTARFDRWGLVKPAGDTSLAMPLVRALKQRPEAVFILSDGYENAPAGRVDEVIRAARGLGVNTPIYQVSPVMGAETAGVRKLSEELAPMPVTRPEAIGLSMVRAALTSDVETGIAGLLNVTRPLLLENGPTRERAAGATNSRRRRANKPKGR